MNHQNTHTKARVNTVTSRRNNSDNDSPWNRDQTSHPHSTNRTPCAATVSLSLSRTCSYSPCIFSINMSCLRFHVNILMQNMNILNNINMMFVVLFILGGVCKKSCVLGSCLMFLPFKNRTWEKPWENLEKHKQVDANNFIFLQYNWFSFLLFIFIF